MFYGAACFLGKIFDKPLVEIDIFALENLFLGDQLCKIDLCVFFS